MIKEPSAWDLRFMKDLQHRKVTTWIRIRPIGRLFKIRIMACQMAVEHLSWLGLANSFIPSGQIVCDLGLIRVWCFVLFFCYPPCIQKVTLHGHCLSISHQSHRFPSVLQVLYLFTNILPQYFLRSWNLWTRYVPKFFV